jgi:hypothetical protein
MISARRRAKAAKSQSRRASKQPRHKDGRFKAETGKTKYSEAVQKKDIQKNGDIVTVETKKKRVEVGGETYYIPVDETGYVPMFALASRLQNIDEGGRKGSKRNILRDLNTDSESVVKGKRLTPEEVAEWWAHPNESDIDGIDTTKDWGKIRGYSRQKYDASRKIMILDAKKDVDAEIRRVLMDNFTKGELDKMASGNGVTVVVENMGDVGSYDPVNKTIRLNPLYSKSDSTITHEFTHHLRLKDNKRNGEVTRSRVEDSISGEDRNLEEAATTAETLTRLTPYKKVDNTGYHGSMANWNDKLGHELVDRDRKIFVGNAEYGLKGLRGKRAIDAVETKFDESEISKLKMSYSSESAKTTLDKHRRDVKK